MKIIKFLTMMILFNLIFSIYSFSSETTNIVLWTRGESENAGGKVWEDLLQKFHEENPGITVKRNYYQTEDLRKLFIERSDKDSDKAPPDIIFVPNDTMGPLSSMSYVIPVSEDTLYQNLLHDIDNRILRNEKINGKNYGIPVGLGNTLILFYNKNYITEIPRKFEDIISLKNNLNDNVYALTFDYDEPYFFIPFLNAFGGTVFAEDNETPNLYTPAMIKALQYMYDLKYKHGILPDSSSATVAEHAFLDNEAATFINGSWGWKSYVEGDDQIEDFVWGTCPLPSIDQVGTLRSYYSSTTLCISSRSPLAKKAAIYDFIEFILDNEFQIEYAKANALVPSVTGARKNKQITSDPFITSSDYMIQESPAMPVVPRMRIIWDSMRPELEKLMADETDATNAAMMMQRNALKKIEEEGL